MKSLEEIFSLAGKVAMITGSGRGLGREMALAFAKVGADIVIVDRNSERDLEAATEVVAEVEALGRRAIVLTCHVGRWDQINDLVDKAYKHFGKVDVLVNNAGMSPLYDSLVNITEEYWDSVMAVNLKGPFRLCALVGNRMAEGEGGSIINISSVASVRPTPKETPYAAAKAGLNALTGAFSVAYGPKVRVNTIMPGPFLTDISKSWDMEAVNRKFENTLALKRGGRPDEIIGAALYFASDASSYTTGAILPVDGGGYGR